MRKPRDYDAELESLDQKAKALKQRKIKQFGELVIACGADTLQVDVLAGALLAATKSDPSTKAAWHQSGAAMFQRKAKGTVARTASPDAAPSQTSEGGTLSLDRQPRPS